MKLRKARGRLAARRRAWDTSGYPTGYRRPGSFKKAWPRGRARSHKAQGA